jgi:hypothetical protein
MPRVECGPRRYDIRYAPLPEPTLVVYGIYYNVGFKPVPAPLPSYA